MKWLEIGTHTRKGDAITVQLHEGYEKALHKLALFSHCSLYFLQEDRIEPLVALIEHADEAGGRLVLTPLNYDGFNSDGQLVDIKPYFPNEEVIIDAVEPEELFFLGYRGKAVGVFVYHGSRPVIQLEGQVPGCVREGDYLRILWYFHRFDKDSFRKNRMCNPPYNNAPKTGIFATRSPVRPNPLASTNIKVTAVDYEGGVLDIAGFDGFPGTEILQLMPYRPSADRVEGARLPPWVSHWSGSMSFEQPKEILPEALRAQREEEEEPVPELDSDTGWNEDYDSNEIHIHKAGIHNLKNVSVSIPKAKITLITGVSGSGKSSLAFDTIHAESRRLFTDLVMSNRMSGETFTESRVERISGLQPSIAITQHGLGSNPRSTVGSATRIADVLKLLFSTIGERLCPICHSGVDESNLCTGCGSVLFDRTPQIFSYNHPDYMCPVCRGLGVELQIDQELIVEHPEKSLLDSASSLYGNLRKHRKKPNANWMRGEILALADDMKVELDRPFQELPGEFRRQFFHGSDGREVSLSYCNSNGRSGVITRPVEGAVNLIRRFAQDSKSSRAGENVRKYMSKKTCSRCGGERLLEEGRLVNICGHRYPEVVNLSIDRLISWCHRIYRQLSGDDREKARTMLPKILFRLKRLRDVGLGYISLDRSIPSLSGGEAQRLKLAAQFGTGLSDILYIMDEPSKGLHPRDYRFLMDALVDLKKHGNTVILVEHKRSFLAIADRHIRMGPKAGRYGGEIVAETGGGGELPGAGQADEAAEFEHLRLAAPRSEDITPESFIGIRGASLNNLRDVDVCIPKGRMTAVIGVSGSGKSSLISKTLYPCMLEFLGREVEERGPVRGISGMDSFTDVNYVNQKPIGANSRSNPGTYTGVFDLIRRCYAALPAAAAAGLGKEHFSFNSRKGQCPECGGLGEVAVNMHYMDDIFIPCSACGGRRYKPEILEIERGGRSIGDILEMEIADLLEVFRDEQDILSILGMLVEVGLGYLKLGQSASSLSGGEAQRIKLAKELYRGDCRNVLYILDEPTSGLHDDDVDKLIGVLQELKAKGASLIVIEHNLRIIRECDYIVELGPGGGEQGGRIMRAGFRDF